MGGWKSPRQGAGGVFSPAKVRRHRGNGRGDFGATSPGGARGAAIWRGGGGDSPSHDGRRGPGGTAAEIDRKGRCAFEECGVSRVGRKRRRGRRGAAPRRFTVGGGRGSVYSTRPEHCGAWAKTGLGQGRDCCEWNGELLARCGFDGRNGQRRETRGHDHRGTTRVENYRAAGWAARVGGEPLCSAAGRLRDAGQTRNRGDFAERRQLRYASACLCDSSAGKSSRRSKPNRAGDSPSEIARRADNYLPDSFSPGQKHQDPEHGRLASRAERGANQREWITPSECRRSSGCRRKSGDSRANAVRDAEFRHGLDGTRGRTLSRRGAASRPKGKNCGIYDCWRRSSGRRERAGCADPRAAASLGSMGVAFRDGGSVSGKRREAWREMGVRRGGAIGGADPGTCVVKAIVLRAG